MCTRCAAAATPVQADSALAHGIDVERLIGANASRWWTLAGIWLTVAFSVGFGLYVNFRAQGRDITFSSSLMVMTPHYFSGCS